jgi:RNA polymerase sigma-70 factor (ECF subfamily)
MEKERGEFEELIKQIRPELHRYAARMIGSAIDGEDVVQEAVLKAFSSLDQIKTGANVRGWLFRIAHNKAIDYLRRRNQQTMEQLDENLSTEPEDLPLEQKEATALALKVFLRLAPRQRSCVILKDVLGYSLAEISALLDASVAEIKAVLHRGRARLRELGKTIETDSAPVLSEREFKLLNRYVERFNARDFEAVRRMLTEETRLDLVGKAKHTGAKAISSNYFHNYSRLHDWHFKLGAVENRPAILVFDPTAAIKTRPNYFLLLTIENEQISLIRDYRYARYITEDAEITVI